MNLKRDESLSWETNFLMSIEVEYSGLSRSTTDLFSWSTINMCGIDPNFLCHKLVTFKDSKPVAQRKRKMGEKR